MVAVLSVLLVVALSLLMVRVGTVALTLTGLSEEVARFQALSAFSQTGFTTGESENVVNGPARRRIVALLIRAGSAGIVTAISTVMLSFVGDRFATGAKLSVLVGGIAAIVVVARSRRLDAMTRPLIARWLRRSAVLDLRDYAGLLHLRDGFRISEVEVRTDGPLTRQSLAELREGEDGVTVLGIERPDGRYEGAPPADRVPVRGEVLLVYGRPEGLDRLTRQEDEVRAVEG